MSETETLELEESALEDEFGASSLETLLEGEVSIDPDAREELREWPGILPRDGINSIDTRNMNYLDRTRTRIGRSLKHGALGGSYILGTVGSSFAAHSGAAEAAVEVTGTAGNSFAEVGAAVAATGSFLATLPVLAKGAKSAGDKAHEIIMPSESGGEYGHIYSGGNEEQMAEILEEADATEYIELGGTSYEMDASTSWNMRYLGDVEEDLLYNVGWEYDEDEERTFIEMDAMIHWDTDPIDLETLDVDDFDMWRFRATKEGHPENWNEFKSIITRKPASEQEITEHFDEAYEVLEDAGYLNKGRPYRSRGTYEGRRRGWDWKTSIDETTNK